MHTGKVWLVGAGPGDPGLMTLRGRQVLGQAQVVVYDSLVGPGVLGMVPQNAQCIDVGKRAGNHPVPQEQINAILLSEAQKGLRVVRLKGGDPFVFGRGGEELELLCQHGIDFEIVPGIPSAVAVPAYAGIPVTHRDCCSSFHVITGHTRKGQGPQIDFEALVRLKGTLVFLMGVSSLEAICRGLMEAGMPGKMPAAVLERGTTAFARRVVSTLALLPKDALQTQIGTPAIIIVGEVCALESQFAWSEKRALGGMRVVLTRARGTSESLREKLQQRGAEVVEMPMISTRLIEEPSGLDAALQRLEDFGWLAFTSAAGVRHFLTYLKKSRRDIRCLAGLRLAAIGPATCQALEQAGLMADLVPGEYTAAGLGEALSQAARGQRVLLLRAKVASAQLTRCMEEAEIDYEDVPLYETASETSLLSPQGVLTGDSREFVCFLSASAVRAFAAQCQPEILKQVQAICIGEPTAAAAEQAGMRAFVAASACEDAMVQRLEEIWKARG